jgi:Uma2 family endonuclease
MLPLVLASPPAPRRATYQDVLDAPAHLVAELIDGVLHTHPRPATPHAQAATVLGEELGPPFKRGRGGPGGWILLYEPEVHLGEQVLVPDLGGWRRETLPILPEVAYLEVRPDWVAEVLSPSTRRHDRALKLPVYQRHGVEHVWLVDPEARTLEVLRLDGGSYRLVVTHAGEAPVRAEPFDAIELDLGALWQR